MAKKQPKKGAAKAKKPVVRRCSKRVPKPKVVRVDAVYSPENRPVCPRCFSRPSVTARYERSLSERGFGIIVTDRIIEGGPVYSFKYPCSNPECFTELFVYCTAALRQHASLMPRMDAASIKRWKTGAAGKDGIWRAGLVLVSAVIAPAGENANKRAYSAPVLKKAVRRHK